MIRFLSAIILFLSLTFFEVQPILGGNIETYYGPEGDLQERMISLYETAGKSIYISCYNITSRPIVKTLIKAKKKGIDVKVITDSGELENKNTRHAVKALLNAGIPVKINRHEGLMHIKQVVIDDAVNTTGSFNQTWSANNLNDERLDIISDRTNSRKAKDKFLSMWNDQERFKDLKENF